MYTRNNIAKTVCFMDFLSSSYALGFTLAVAYLRCGKYSRVPNKRRPTGINFQFFSHGYGLIWYPTLIHFLDLGT